MVLCGGLEVRAVIGNMLDPFASPAWCFYWALDLMVSVNGCLSLYDSPVMSSQLIQSLHLRRLQLPLAVEDGWMNFSLWRIIWNVCFMIADHPALWVLHNKHKLWFGFWLQKSDITVQHNTIYALWFIDFTSYLYSYSVMVFIPVLLFSCLWKLRLLLFSVPFTLSEGFLMTGLVLGRTLLKFPSRIHSCWSPSSGVMRLVGSQLNTHSNIIKSEPQDCFLIFYQQCNSHQR